MKIVLVIVSLFATVFCLSFKFESSRQYQNTYNRSLESFKNDQTSLLNLISSSDLSNPLAKEKIKTQLHRARQKLKSIDFWLRYFEPIVYRRINGPLPVEWENEVFEKFEPPYRREGAGLTLAELYLDEENANADSLGSLISISIDGIATFEADSITSELARPDHFFLANRLYILNLAAIYTTGYECPDTNRIIPELLGMMKEVRNIYNDFEADFKKTPLTNEFKLLYDRTIAFIEKQPVNYSGFDHYTFLREYVNPLFRMNQKFIREYGVVTRNFNDYSLNNEAESIFEKTLFNSQNTKGIFSLVEDEALMAEVKKIGKLLFYDPILSANNSRSCASCHKPTEYFTDTSQATAFQFDHNLKLSRNTPSLINSVYNHLLMLDGKHISLQDQGKDVMHNPQEMNMAKDELVKKIMSCCEYKDAFKRFLKHTPEEKEVVMDHIISAITFYYADFSQYQAPFDDAMNKSREMDASVVRGFNLFMSKAQCATCHFVPMFNGVKPPYIGTEFEVLGVPSDKEYSKLSEDKGRYLVNPAVETLNAFRTTTIRNSEHTKPYMHNGVFNTLEEVIDLYDGGGGAGRKLSVANQTLSSDSLRLSPSEKADLVAFIHSLNEKIIFEEPPLKLPSSGVRSLNSRKVGGDY